MAATGDEPDSPLHAALGLAHTRPVPTRVSELVARLSEAIHSGSLRAGDRLPTEPQLMEAFGVSRTVIREAVAAMKAEGLVVTRQGSGAFVASDVRRRPFRIDPDELGSNESLVQVMELRLCIEVEAAALAAKAGDPEAVAAVQARLDELTAAIDAGHTGVEADFALHCAIADATGNPLIGRFLRFLGPFIIPRPLVRMRPHAPRARREYMAQMRAEHGAIVRAIAAGDAEAARLAMREHLQRGLALNRNAPQDTGAEG